MSDRFDFLELGDAPPKAPAAQQSEGMPDSLAEQEPSARKSVRLKIQEVIGEPGREAGQFMNPAGIAVDGYGNLYVADTGNHRVQRIALNGDVLLYGGPGQGMGQLMGPVAVAPHPDGRFFLVADQGNQRIAAFRITGEFDRPFTGFLGPSGVCFDGDGRCWIADTGNSRVLCVDARSGVMLLRLDRSQGVLRPIALCCDERKNVYVTDEKTRDVTCYSPVGQKVRAVSEFRNLSQPRQTAVDKEGRLYIAESGASRLHVLSPDAVSIETVEQPMRKLGPLKQPCGVALGPNGEIYLSDTLNHRILRFAWE